MNVEKDICRVCVPMAAGASCAAFAMALAGTAGCCHVCTMTVSLLCWSLAWTIWCRRRMGYSRHLHSPLLWIAMFFLLGALCYATQRTVSGAMVPFSIMDSAALGLKETVRAIPFRDSENNALVQALILGDRSSLSRGTTGAFRTSGASHMLALSGMHLGIIYIVITRILAVFGNSVAVRKSRSALVIALTGLYTMMCGAGPSLMRAWLFISLAEAGKILGRPQKAGDVFCSALALHLVFRPASITEPGFQLSYSAVLGIVYVWPVVREWYQGDSPGAKIWQAASLSICAQAFTAPVALYYFGTFPKYFLITNLAAAPLMTLAMICSILSICVSAIFPEATAAIHILEYPLNWLRGIIELTQGCSARAGRKRPSYFLRRERRRLAEKTIASSRRIFLAAEKSRMAAARGKREVHDIICESMTWKQ